MPHPKVALVAAIAVAALAAPGAAYAIDPGVNYDPGSPAGKEYAIPLVEGRSDAAGTTNQRSGGNIPFGVGIKPPGGNGGGENGSGRGAGGTGGSGPGGHGQVQGARPGESAKELQARITQAENPDGTASSSLLLALAVLLPAALLGFLLMQRSQVSRTGTAA
jgi:hypothetical protein